MQVKSIIFYLSIYMTPEALARRQIDDLLTQAGWHVCNVDQVNLHAALGVAIREFPLNPGHGFADYLLYWSARPKRQRVNTICRFLPAGSCKSQFRHWPNKPESSPKSIAICPSSSK